MIEIETFAKLWRNEPRENALRAGAKPASHSESHHLFELVMSLCIPNEGEG
jgi:hypothetical protein